MTIIKSGALAAVAFSLSAVASQGATAGLSGAFYVSATPFSTIADARAIIAAATGGPDATFTATALDYPAGATLSASASTPLATWLGSVAGSARGATGTAIGAAVFLFEGVITLGAGTQSFEIGSDDGFELNIGGGPAEGAFDGNRGFAATTVEFDAGSGGTFDFELLFWDGPSGFTGLEARLNGAIIDDTITTTGAVGVIPVPAALPMLVSALGLAGWLRRRRA